MLTEILPTTEESIEKAAALLKTGAVVAFPTETVYGLGANGLDAGAVARIFEAKGRPQDNPLILHVSSREGLAPLVKAVPREAEMLMDAFWPGPLTIVLESSSVVPLIARAGLPTVAVRCPADGWARRLIDACGFPIAAPSANLSGRPSPTTAAAVFEDMTGRIPLILDGGPCSIGLESTVLTLAAGKPSVLRPGGVTPEQIAAVIGEVEVDASALKQLEPGAKAASPGMMHRHYAPQASLTVVAGEAVAAAARICSLYDEAEASGRNPAVLARVENVRLYVGRAVDALGLAGNTESVGNALFESLRKMDADGRTDVFAEAVEPSGFGLAVMNRLLRAAGFRFIQV
jgi:L-threonylcarbamoyladenylate synthase